MLSGPVGSVSPPAGFSQSVCTNVSMENIRGWRAPRVQWLVPRYSCASVSGLERERVRARVRACPCASVSARACPSSCAPRCPGCGGRMAGLLPTYANIHFARGFTRGDGDLPHEEVLLHLGPAHYVGIYTTQSISACGANAAVLDSACTAVGSCTVRKRDHALTPRGTRVPDRGRPQGINNNRRQASSRVAARMASNVEDDATAP